MKQSEKLFSDKWICHASNADHGSWAYDVWRSIDSSGVIYLNYLEKWYSSLPPKSDTNEHLRRRLQSHVNSEHLGGANELAWWAYMKQSGFDVLPVDTAASPRPDFHVISPCNFFAEVTTLNLSDEEVVALTRLAGARLSPKATLCRIARTCNEKLRQLKFGSDQGLPSILVIFDYSAFSGLGVGTNFDIEKALVIDQTSAFSDLNELSALVYIERSTRNGNPVFLQSKSIVFHNSQATFPLGLEVFPYLIQHTNELVLEPSPCDGGVIKMSDNV